MTKPKATRKVTLLFLELGMHKARYKIDKFRGTCNRLTSIISLELNIQQMRYG